MGRWTTTPATDLGTALLRRGAHGYEEARSAAVWNDRKPDRFPAALVRAASEDDVVRAVAHARERGLRVTVRSGGHNWSGAPLRDDALLLDVSGLRDLALTPGSDGGPATATVGPGATGRDLVAALTPQHLAFPVGHCPSVALGGFLLSGGLGWNSRDWGVSCADVREIRVVTAAGRTVDCSEREHPDLFWAARGAGPGFCAAVTRFRLALHPHPASIMTTRYTFRIAETPVLTGWAEPVVRGLPPYVETSFVLTSWGPATEAAPAGPRITLSATAFAASAEQARQALAPLAEGPLVGLAVDEQPPVATTYAGLHEGAGSLWPPGHRYAADTLWSREGYRTQLSRIADTVAHAPSDRSLVLAPVKPVSEDPALLRNMAFAPLGASYLVAYAVWDDPDEDTAQGHWLQDTMAAADPDGEGLHYIAETDLEAGPARARRCYPPATWEHLQAVRERWDPEGRFHSYLAP